MPESQHVRGLGCRPAPALDEGQSAARPTPRVPAGSQLKPTSPTTQPNIIRLPTTPQHTPSTRTKVTRVLQWLRKGASAPEGGPDCCNPSPCLPAKLQQKIAHRLRLGRHHIPVDAQQTAPKVAARGRNLPAACHQGCPSTQITVCESLVHCTGITWVLDRVRLRKHVTRMRMRSG